MSSNHTFKEVNQKELKKLDNIALGILIFLIVAVFGYKFVGIYNTNITNTTMPQNNSIIDETEINETTFDLISFDQYLKSDEIGINVNISGYIMLKRKKNSEVYEPVIYDDFEKFIYLNNIKTETYNFFERDIKSSNKFNILGKLYNREDGEKFVYVDLVISKNS